MGVWVFFFASGLADLGLELMELYLGPKVVPQGGGFKGGLEPKAPDVSLLLPKAP